MNKSRTYFQNIRIYNSLSKKLKNLSVTNEEEKH